MVLRNFLARLLILCLGLTLVACSEIFLPPKAPKGAELSASTALGTAADSGQVGPAGVQTTPSPTAEPTETAVQGDIEAGRALFVEVCAACHNQTGAGIEGIGVNLRDSQFVGGLTTPQLADFIKMGRSLSNPINRTGIKMPPKGGRPDLTDEDVLNIAAYVHDLNAQANPAKAYLDWLADGGAEKIEPALEISRQGLSGPSLEGQTTFLRFCAVCHGPHGEGVESLGKNLAESEFVAELSDAELAEFIVVGRSVDDPLNTTGIQMLPYGGQPVLTETELTNLVAYLRALGGEGVPAELASADTAASPDQAEAIAIIEGSNPQCFTCHRIGDQGNDGPGPHLNGLAEVAGSYVSGLSAEDYIRQSILEPGAFLAPECPTGPCLNIMPNTYGDSLSEAEVDTLVKFLLSLPPE
ncbi:MAG: hypothetical protein DPW09_29775 [Anaerolineae bacterium]|nr:c-type cytochrome [Anaerolineales bacterium]MCQ3977637.1 hypothetical protein [Anaerolineae bacterium]